MAQGLSSYLFFNPKTFIKEYLGIFKNGRKKLNEEKG